MRIISDQHPPTLVSVMLSIKRNPRFPGNEDAILRPEHLRSRFPTMFVVYRDGIENYIDGIRLYPRLKLIKSRHRRCQQEALKK